MIPTLDLKFEFELRRASDFIFRRFILARYGQASVTLAGSLIEINSILKKYSTSLNLVGGPRSDHALMRARRVETKGSETNPIETHEGFWDIPFFNEGFWGRRGAGPQTMEPMVGRF